MSRLHLQSADEWVPIKDPSCIGVLDCVSSEAGSVAATRARLQTRRKRFAQRVKIAL